MKPHFCSAIALAVVATCIATPAFAQARTFDVPAQDAITGVPAFGVQAGLQIVASGSGLKGKRTRAVKGTMPVDQALQQLLRGTGLRIASRNGTIVTLAPGASDSAAKRKPKIPAAPAPAEPAPYPSDEPTKDIIVTGTHARLSPRPQSEKQSNIAFVSTVGAEEMAKRTDVTVVTALERLPGVIRQRGTNTLQGWYPAIRGFPGWYNSVSIDGGMLYLSTRNQRGVPLDFIPTAIVNELVVSKTVTPEMDPNSIGGHIDIRTLRSFDNDGKALTTIDGALTNYTQGGSLHSANPSYNINGVIKRTFGPDNNFGFVLAGATHKDQYNELTNLTTGFVQQNGLDVPSGNIEQGNYNSRSHGASFMGKLEGRGDKWYGYVAANYFQDIIERTLSRSNISIVPANVTNVTEDTGSFTGATPSALSNTYSNNRHIFSARGGLEYQTNDNSKIVFNASYLRALFNEASWTGANFVGPTVSGTYDINNSVPASTIVGPPSLNDPTKWVPNSTTPSQIFFPLTTDIVTARLEYKSNDFDFSHGFGYDFGVDYRQMWRHLDQYQYNYALPAGSNINLSQVLSDGSTFNGADPSQAIYVDTSKYWNLIKSLGARSTVIPLTSNYNLNEAVIAPFAALYYTTDKFRVIVGARYNITHYTDKTNTITNGAVTPFNITRTIPYILPNVQGYYNIRSNLRVRAAFTETTALQNYSDFAMGVTTNQDNKGNFFIQGSNPLLKPRRSYNEDLSLEWYLRKGYFSLGYFHKTITNETQNVTQLNFDANGVLTSQVQTPVNAGGEHDQGIEFESEWHDFTGIAPWLRGFSVNANGAYFIGETNAVVGSGVARRFDAVRQQPKWDVNLILTYDRGPFSISVVGQSRGKALTSIGTIAATDLYTDGYTDIDAKISYQASRNLKVYVSGTNLTNYWYREVYGANHEKVSTAIQAGPIYTVGAKVTF